MGLLFIFLTFFCTNLFSFQLFAMDSSTVNLDAIYDEWILIPTDKEDTITKNIVSSSLIEQQNNEALTWAVKRGYPPKIIKTLAHPESVARLLCIARSNFARINGKKYALEAAILQDNLNFVKTLLSATNDSEFKAQIGTMAIAFGKRKTLFYIVNSTSDFITLERLPMFFKLIKKAIEDQSKRPLKMIFKHNLIIHHFHYELLVNHGIEQSQQHGFMRGSCFFENLKLKQTTTNHTPMIHTL